ncbi:MAG: hypothetical protein FWD01_02760 [Defluviitaleaceae bacterium]|nr:hypothetical protein [Defluviitaleaceae bacterium]
MIKLFAGEKGEGKTKKLIAMANAALKTTEGHIVFIDDDMRNMHELNRDIRLVDTSEYPLSNYREFVGFIYGILSQNNDISEIFVDSLSSVINNLCNDDLLKLKVKLEKICKNNGVHFFITLNCNPNDLPDEIRALMV